MLRLFIRKPEYFYSPYIMFVILQGGKILTGGSVIECEGNYVQATIVEISSSAGVVKEELFAPVLYVMKFQVTE